MKTHAAPLLLLIFLASCDKKSSREIYSLTLYRLDTVTQEQVVDDYLSKALLPALHRASVSSVGVFKPAPPG